MPSNTRGKIKEHLEGCHRNTEAIKEHCAKILALVGDKNPKVTAAIEALSNINTVLDESAQNIYSLI
ncbi:hypothetical protein LCGC14_0872400 [marine sediment metagenome]|uniref:Uncharacterized protein n=1 Tax=marine sediment metagenome TaxID=412755 RepID=A0A0F9SB98_9ZZZZ